MQTVEDEGGSHLGRFFGERQPPAVGCEVDGIVGEQALCLAFKSGLTAKENPALAAAKVQCQPLGIDAGLTGMSVHGVVP